MTIKQELQNHLIEMLKMKNLECANKPDVSWLESYILNEIREYIANSYYSDFVVVEKIVWLFEKFNIDCNGRHDYNQ